MDLSEQTKTFLRERDVNEQFFPALARLQLVNTDLLRGVTLDNLASVMDIGSARYIHDKIHPLKPLPKKVAGFLAQCGVDKSFGVYFARLRITNVAMVHHVNVNHLLDAGMEKFHAEIIVPMIQTMLTKSTCVDSSEHSSDDSSDDSADDSAEHSAEEPYKGFIGAKRLHLGNFSVEKFKGLHRKFNLRRKRFGSDKWTYCYSIDGQVQEVQSGLKHILQQLDLISKRV